MVWHTDGAGGYRPATAEERDRAARMWLALVVRLGLGELGDVTGVVTEIEILRELAARTPEGAAYVAETESWRIPCAI